MMRLATRRAGAPKIAVITVFPPNGAPEADHAFHLCEHLADTGLKVDVVTEVGSVASRHAGIVVHPVMCDWSWRELPRLTRLLLNCRPDAVLLLYLGWIYNHHPMITFAPTLVKRLLPATPFVTLFEGADGALTIDGLTRPVRALRRAAAQWAGADGVDYHFGALMRDSDRVLALCDEHLEKLSGYFPGLRDKSALIPVAPLIHICLADEGQARRRGRERLGVSPDDFLIAYFGYVYPGKGVETLLEAFRLVCRRRTGLRLALIGGALSGKLQGDSRDYAEELKRMIRELGLADRALWTGGFDYDSEMPSECLRAADLCALPFDRGVRLNNSSFAAAAAHGLPIITTAVGADAAPFADGRNVILCPPRDAAALAAAIEAAIDQPALRTRLSRGALQLSDEYFSWAKAVSVIKHSFNSALT